MRFCKISGFSDEIAPETEKQFSHLQELGIRYFEPRGVDGKSIAELSAAEARELKRKMDAAGIAVSSIGSPLGKIGIREDFAPHLERQKRVMETAHILEAKTVRVFSFFIPKGERPEDFRREVMERMGAMTRAAQAEDIVLLHENEKEIYGDTAPRCLDILETIGSPYLRAVFDPANFVQCGQRVYPDAYEQLRPYLAYMHIKDALEDGRVVPAGLGVGCVEEVLRALWESGYDGFLSLEPHLGEFQGLQNLEHGEAMTGLEMSTPEKFTLAYESLIKILERVGARWNA